MQLARSGIALDPRRFGRRRVGQQSAAAAVPMPLSDDIRLFGTTFVAGFLFVSLLLA